MKCIFYNVFFTVHCYRLHLIATTIVRIFFRYHCDTLLTENHLTKICHCPSLEIGLPPHVIGKPFPKFQPFCM